MELWRDTIEFQGKYQLLNISNPVLAFGKLKWIFSCRFFFSTGTSPPPPHPAFALQTQRNRGNNCYSAVKYSNQNCVCGIFSLLHFICAQKVLLPIECLQSGCGRWQAADSLLYGIFVLGWQCGLLCPSAICDQKSQLLKERETLILQQDQAKWL